MEDTEPGEHWIDLSARERSDIDADIALSRGDLAIAVVILEIEAAARKNQLDAGIERCLAGRGSRSEEHTSELQSLMRISYADVCLKQKSGDERPDKHSSNDDLRGDSD